MDVNNLKMPKNKKIGILRGGGDCPGLNSVIRAVTKSAHEHDYEVLGFKDSFKGLVENDFIRLTNPMVSNILTQGGTILGTSNIANPYKWSFKNKKGDVFFKDVSQKAISNFKKNNLEALIVLGGDGSMTIANKLVKSKLNIIGIPKTIDNDLPLTDTTFGFNTAVAALMELVNSLYRLKVRLTLPSSKLWRQNLETLVLLLAPPFQP